MAEYIEREKTVELLRSLGNREYRKEKGTIQEAIKMISYPEYTPTADVAPVVHAQWIEDGSGIIICPECKRGYNLIAKYTHYCPYCGAIMDGGNSDAAD